MSYHIQDAPQTGGKLWLTLIVVCLGALLIALDATIVNVALPPIQEDLKFTESSLVWVVNAYLISFGACLLLGGRLGDLYGHRRIYLVGIALFTVASLACGAATNQLTLILARFAQGAGGALVSAAALSLIMIMFADNGRRSRALGAYSFICASGGSLGLLLGGSLTSALDWHWIFLINCPIGVGIYAACCWLLPKNHERSTGGSLDMMGALTVTAASMLSVFAIVNGGQIGWTSWTMLGLSGAAAVLFSAFLAIEARVPAPLLPLYIFSRRNFALSNIIGALWAAGSFSWYFTCTLYLQRVLLLDPMQVGLAFLPPNIINAVFSVGLSAALMARLGIKASVGIGLLLAAAGLALLARVPPDGTVLVDVVPSMILLGVGGGIAFNPLLLAALGDLAPKETGLGSGVLNTGIMLGGAIGLATLASLAASRTSSVLSTGAKAVVALTEGYRFCFLSGAACLGTAAILGAVLLRNNSPKPMQLSATNGNPPTPPTPSASASPPTDLRPTAAGRDHPGPRLSRRAIAADE